ncbi:MAG: putative phospholipid ABC transporter permease protein MlaE [Deltaproteobacteria bacterium ADurb.Bin510]|nr:MAG: putative phospholipid ABC transporter permease protein MlaE [Deltaproteobacteria bacterium ADurb.Bin510]
MAAVSRLGKMTLSFVEEVGNFGLFFYRTATWFTRRPLYVRELVKQMNFIGVGSATVVLLTGLFTGMVLALQMEYGFGLFGAEALVGSTATLGLLRELGPVLAALMVTARAGSAITAELGTMRVTEQIDALTVMGVNPYKYLVVPRVLAGVIMTPLLTVAFDAIGMIGTYLVGVHLLMIDEGLFTSKIVMYVDYTDLFNGLIKSAFFGLILASVGCYKGFSTTGGAEGVGRATTYSVVISAVSILIADYVLTAIMF